MDFEDDAKWQHMAFAASRALVTELAHAVDECFASARAAPLLAYHLRHAADAERARAEIKIVVSREELEALVAGVRGAFDRRGRSDVHARFAESLRDMGSGGHARVVRTSWESLQARASQATRFAELGVLEILLDNELDMIEQLAARLASAPAAPTSYDDMADLPASNFDQMSYVFAECVYTCIGPFPENVGIGCTYELVSPVARFDAGFDPFVCDELMPRGRMPGFDVVIHHALADTVPHGLLVGDSGPIAWAHGEDLEAFLARLRAPDVVAGAWLAARAAVPNTDERFVISDGFEASEVLHHQATLEARIAGYRAACEKMLERSDALVTWIAKNPAL